MGKTVQKKGAKGGKGKKTTTKYLCTKKTVPYNISITTTTSNNTSHTKTNNETTNNNNDNSCANSRSKCAH